MSWWTSPQWRVEVDTWIGARLREAGMAITGTIEQPRVRFWSTQLTVPTDAGTFWFKENNPGQAFEASLMDTLARLVPDRIVAPLAVEPSRGWMLTPDAGPTLRGPAPDVASWERVAREFAHFQRDLTPYRDCLLAVGLDAWPARETAARIGVRLQEFGQLPASDARHLTAEQVRTLTAGLDRVRAAASMLDELGIADSLQHNDLHDNNAFAVGSGPLRFFDLGDAVWAHPLAVLDVPLRLLREQGMPAVEVDRVSESYLEVFSDLAPRRGCVRRCPPPPGTRRCTGLSPGTGCWTMPTSPLLGNGRGTRWNGFGVPPRSDSRSEKHRRADRPVLASRV